MRTEPQDTPGGEEEKEYGVWEREYTLVCKNAVAKMPQRSHHESNF